MTRSSNGRVKQVSGFTRAVSVVLIIFIIVLGAGIFIYLVVANTTLVVNLEYKGKPYSGSVDVEPHGPGENPAAFSIKNGSSVQFLLRDGTYIVSALYTNSTGTYYAGGWEVDLTGGNILISYHMTIELSNSTASFSG
jgi:hypothetical protein